MVSHQRLNQLREPKKHNARVLLAKAVGNGEIIRPTNCSNCDSFGRIEGHHQDYSKPLEVIWLCRGCHGQLHYSVVRPELKEVTGRSVIVTLSIDEAHEKIHQKVGNRSALYRWALWEWHKGNKQAEKAADAPTTRRRPPVKK